MAPARPKTRSRILIATQGGSDLSRPARGRTVTTETHSKGPRYLEILDGNDPRS